MRFLVTRPQPDCKRTADKLRNLGHEVDEVPLLFFEAMVPERLKLKKVAALVFTSRKAVAVMAKHPQFADLTHLPVFTVGEATADVSREAGFATVQSARGDVAALGRLILDQRATLNGGDVLYPAANARAGDLDSILAAGDVNCRVLPVYRMTPAQTLPLPVVEALATGSYDGVLIFSKRTAETLHTLLKSYKLHHIFSSLHVYAISHQAVEPLTGLERVYISDAPREEALLDLALADC